MNALSAGKNSFGGDSRASDSGGTGMAVPNVAVRGDEVACIDFHGLGPGGERPARLSEECQAALDSVACALSEHGLAAGDIRHVAAMLREGAGFAQCIATLADALAPARPALTLRIVQEFPVPDQRLALSVTASAHH